ncbi:MAG: SAM-dependent methyltransferase, partial [Gammaproteobacteria bacterium]|nr:SAM-dependent methyltransferase [Gammaproteobacteria bacterium]
DLRQRQQTTISSRAAELLERVVWLDELPESICGVVVANELLDAMAVHRFVMREAVPHEVMVVWDDASQIFQTIEEPISDSRLRRQIEALGLPDGYSSELNLNAIDWIATLGERLQTGAILLVDYGHAHADYYHQQRSEGTLLCHYQHRAHPNPLIFVGIQDITAHVDFTAVADAALETGLHVHGYTNQANFLLGCGITEYLGQMVSFDEGSMAQQIEVTNQLKKLTMPGEMGESFKVIMLTRGIDIPLIGFSVRDDRNRL